MASELDFDLFGHCICCSKLLYVKDTIDGKQQSRFLPNHSQTTLLLSDGSKMDICMCKPCKLEVPNHDLDKIMDKVKRGWKHELDSLTDWPEEKKQQYYDRYNVLVALDFVEGKRADAIAKIYDDYLASK